ncbi:glycosyltransferase [Nocardiopsis ansamitocini]|nr:glycosyltransferase [Nocardiopsis ansamitocini]
MAVPASRPLTVLIGTDTYPPDVNGAACFTTRLAHGLGDRGTRVHVLCQSDSGPPVVREQNGVTVHRLRSVPSLAHQSLRLAVPLGGRGHLDRLLARVRPDVIHIQNHFIVGRLLLAAARRHGVPVVATNHFMPENLFNHLRVPDPLRLGVGSYAWRDLFRVLGQVQHVTTPTRIAARLLVDGGFTRPVEALSCGIDLGRFQPVGAPEDRSRVRARFGLPDRPSTLFVGRLDEEKRIEDLVRALADITVPDCQLLLVGVGARRQRLTRLAEECGVDERVHFLGFVSDEELPLVYHAADVFAIAGTAELQSIATLEAMASGLPVVAADAMALPHLVTTGGNGYLYAPGDHVELAKYLSELLGSPALAAAMGAKSRQAATRHDHQASLDRFEEIYRTVADREGPAPA